MCFAGTVDDVTTSNVWARQLSDGACATLFINDAAVLTDVMCDEACLNAAFQNTAIGNIGDSVVGAQKNPFRVHIYDIWNKTEIGTVDSTNGITVRNVWFSGGSTLYRLTRTT